MIRETFVTVKEVAESFSVSAKTVYQWAELGQIPNYKINGCLRFAPSEIEEWKKTWHREPREGYNLCAQTLISPKKGGK